VVDDSWDEEVWMEVDAFEAAFIVQNLGERVDGSCVGAVAGDKRLEYKPRTD